MLKFVLLLFTVGLLGAWAAPIPAPQRAVPSHIVIVTPQAQVHLDSAGLKYESPAAFFQHLSPLARLAAPHHDETIVYVPASAAAASAPLIPFDPVSVARSASAANELSTVSTSASASAAPTTLAKTGSGGGGSDTKQLGEIEGQWQMIQGSIQSGVGMYAPQLSEAAAAAASAAATASSGLFPGLFPGLYPAPANSKDDIAAAAAPDVAAAPATAPVAAQPLIASEARRYFAISPAVPHVVEFVHTPVFVAPVAAVRSRRLLPETPFVPLPATLASSQPAPEALPLKTVAPIVPIAPIAPVAPIAPIAPIAPQQQLKADELPAAKEPEKKDDFGRFLEANALKEDAATAAAAADIAEEPKPSQQLLKTDQKLASANIAAEAAASPAVKALLTDAAVVAPQVPVIVVPDVPAAPVAIDAEVPQQLKVA